MMLKKTPSASISRASVPGSVDRRLVGKEVEVGEDQRAAVTASIKPLCDDSATAAVTSTVTTAATTVAIRGNNNSGGSDAGIERNVTTPWLADDHQCDLTKRRSTFYVPLTTTTNSSTLDNGESAAAATDESLDLSACSFDWSINDSLTSSSASSLADDNVNNNSSSSGRRYQVKPDLLLGNTAGGESSLAAAIKWAKSAKTNDQRQQQQQQPSQPKSNRIIEINYKDDQVLRPREKIPLSRCASDQVTSSTPIKLLAKSRSRTNILNLADRMNLTTSPQLKEKSKTLPQNLNNNCNTSGGCGGSSATGTSASLFPPKHSFLLKSSPKILLSSSPAMNSSGGHNSSCSSNAAAASPQIFSLTAKSPRKSLSFIRRSHSTKMVSRSSSLLRSFTKNGNGSTVDDECEDQTRVMIALNVELLERLYKLTKAEDQDENLRRIFFKERREDVDRLKRMQMATERSATIAGRYYTPGPPDTDDGGIRPTENDDAIHSDTSYEKACRRGSAPSTPILGQGNAHNHSRDSPEQPTISRFTNFFSKRSFRSNPLKRTKSVTKLERTKRGPGSSGGGGLRGSRSHESLLSSHAVMSTIDLSSNAGTVGVAAVHQSVLGRRHCFQVRGGPRGERYYSCGSRQERDLWIYSLRKSIQPNGEQMRRTDNSLKMWIYEAKALPPKKKYFCEINLDKTLYGRTSVKLRTDLLFWGEYFDFPDIPDINVITVNVYRECEKKKKRDKHIFVGSVKIPIHEVTQRAFSEDWYPIMSEKHNSISRGSSSSKEIIPTLRIKCRFQSIDILPLNIYADFLHYLKQNYKKICEMLEPVIGVKAKEDIGQALVLLMHSQGMASAFLTDVVALDLLRVGDQRLTFRGNSLATKSMEAFLKLTGEQYLASVLTEPISEIIASDRDCEVDPLKATGSLSRQQQSLRSAVMVAWKSIAESTKNFPPQLRECFATFRERLMVLDREDMADNLISASIFLRFLCPAILSPSLFNITNELPSARATRNLTLVAKTLQTLANFTRFQAKESFMEFLNDFLEQEATHMKEFLHTISTRNTDIQCMQEQSILDWAGYIDQGKQLSILHTLLSENLSKLPTNRQPDMQELVLILDRITKAKETVSYSPIMLHGSGEHDQAHMDVESQSSGGGGNQENMQPRVYVPKPNERGVIRGVLTPSSLEKNIFRYNDPTVAPLIHNLNAKNSSNSQLMIGSNLDGMSTLQHSHSTSSISSAPNYYYNSANHMNSTPSKSSRKMMGQYPVVANSTEAICGHNNNNNGNGYKQPLTRATSGSNGGPHETKHISHHVYDGLMMNHNDGGNNTAGRSNNGGYRANTLPKHNGVSSPNQSMISKVDVDDKQHGGVNLIQIGLDPSSAFVRKSPTPHLKLSHNNLTANGGGLQKSRGLNDSQLSLQSDRSGANKYNLNIGIPHTDHYINPPNNHHQHQQQQQQYYQLPPPHLHHQHHNVSYLSTNHIQSHGTNFKMPMNLEDLDDLLKYADEHNNNNSTEDGVGPDTNNNNGGRQLLDAENGNNPLTNGGSKSKDLLTAKGSNNSISNMCSSGYQSIATQSQSSSPIESHDYLNNKSLAGVAASKRTNGTTAAATVTANGGKMVHGGGGGGGPLKYQFGGTKATVNAVINNNQHHMMLIGGSQKSSSLTPSSSEERLSEDQPFHLHPVRNGSGSGAANGAGGGVIIGEIVGESELNMLASGLNGRPSSASSSSGGTGQRSSRPYGRTPRTNPLYYNGTATGNAAASTLDRSKLDDFDNSASLPYNNNNNTNSPMMDNGALYHNGNGNNNKQHHNGRFQRRLSLESADSSTDTEGALDGGKRRRNLAASNSLMNSSRSVEQCEREIQRLQESVDNLRHKLEESDLRDSNNDLLSLSNHHSDTKMRSIISRLIAMEEELRREQLKMSLALSHKQRVIEAQGQQIAALDAANNRLLSALSSLRQRYESQNGATGASSGSSSTSSGEANSGAPPSQQGQASTTC